MHSDSSSDGVDSSYGDSDDESSDGKDVDRSDDGNPVLGLAKDVGSDEENETDKDGPKKTNGGEDPDMMDTDDTKADGNDDKNKIDESGDDDSDENEVSH